MKQLTILSAILFSGSLLAQSEYCGVGTVWDVESQTCIGIENAEFLDANLDGVIGVEDLLNLLSHFGDEDMDFDGVYDSVDLCTDTTACNYVLSPSEPCEFLDAIGVCGGGCSLDTNEDGVCDVIDPCDNLAEISFNGYAYDLVAIGEQCWFAENLRTEHYNNGNSIPANLSDGEWSIAWWGAVAVYGEESGCEDESPDGDACDPDWSLNEYGRLYNWYAVNDERGLCPSGWHVPTDVEWMVLEEELGITEGLDSVGWRGTDQGTQMKTTYGWNDGGNGSNSSGFSALPGGRRSYLGDFWNAGFECRWWSSSQAGTSAWARLLNAANPNIQRTSPTHARDGCSVRCLKD